MKPIVDVAPSGGIILGSNVVCDGFHRDIPNRIQTHIHGDHLGQFETSKGLQNIYSSAPTRNLLIAEFDSDLEYRENLIALELGEAHAVGTDRILLVSSGHMLGAVQVCVETELGTAVGYSGDFAWPLRDVIQVEQLVVDATYGSPASVRHFSQEQAEMELCDLVLDRLRHGPVNIRAHRGTVQRALMVLTGRVQYPIIGSPRFCHYADVFRRYRVPLEQVISSDSPEAREARLSGRYIEFRSQGDREVVDPVGASIVLSAFAAQEESAILRYAEDSYRVALSDHADFNGTLDYVEATGASFVVTDGRQLHGSTLAAELRYRLGIDAMASGVGESREWGV